MIHLERLPEPEILIRKKAEWLKKFLESGKDRPESSTYGHKDIRAQLYSISYNKCFYCERKLSEKESQIDHYIEVANAAGKDLAFEWNNLFLVCDNCNKKVPHNAIPVENALNPFVYSNDEIEQHITFDVEIIRIKNNSEIGAKTIQKFRLDKLEHIRLQFYREFTEQYTKILKRTKTENREITEDEKEQLKSFSYPDHPFSLMFKVILRKENLL